MKPRRRHERVAPTTGGRKTLERLGQGPRNG